MKPLSAFWTFSNMLNHFLVIVFYVVRYGHLVREESQGNTFCLLITVRQPCAIPLTDWKRIFPICIFQ